MTNLLRFPSKVDTSKPLYEGPEIVGVPRDQPKNGTEYLKLCKYVLEKEDYIDVLVGILDIEFYVTLEKELQVIVDHYHAYEGTKK